MFPIALDLTRIPVLLAGSGELVLKRLAYLDEANASNVVVFCANPTQELKDAAGARLIPRLPTSIDFENYTVILLAGLERPVAERMVAWARLLGRLVNVEDVNDLCDFYFTANVRRGDLVIAVSTSGASPTLARKIRDVIAARFGAEWKEYVNEIAQLRQTLRSNGASMREVIDSTEQYLQDKGWLRQKEDVA